MFRSLKKSARQTVLQNYKKFFLATLLLLIAQTSSNLIVNILSSVQVWLKVSDAVRLLAVLGLLLSELVLIPVFITVIFKTAILLNQTSLVDFKAEMRKFLNISNIGKVVLIALLPGLLNLYLEISHAELSALRLLIFPLKGMPLFLLTLLSTLLQWAMYAVYFTIAAYGTALKETIAKTMKVLKTGFVKFVLLMLSFILWILGMTVLCTTIGFAIYGMEFLRDSGSTTLWEILQTFGMGISLFFIPYSYTTYALFFKERLEVHINNKKKSTAKVKKK